MKHLSRVHKRTFQHVHAFQIELEFGSGGFWGKGKTRVTGEKPLGARERTNNKLKPHTAFIVFFFNIIPTRSDWLSRCLFILQMWTRKSNYLSNLSAYCFRANLRVTPKRGTAIMWYNHKIDESTGWMSSLDSLSYHGGCDVIKGHKWIVNNWIDIIGDNWDDLRTWSGIHYRIDDMEQE